MKILISDSREALGGSAKLQKAYLEEKLKDAEIEVYYYEGNQAELFEKCHDMDGLLTSFLPMNQDFLAHCSKLSAISISAVGYNTLDVEEAKKRNITVMTLDDYCTEEVADHTLAMLLSLSRRLKEYESNIWNRQQHDYVLPNPIKRLRGQKMGIFGYGRIGRAVARRARAFGIEIYVFQNNRHPVKEEEGIHLASAEEIYEECSIITNHMPQTLENEHFFNEAAFQKMMCHPIFINTGRGSAVDERALEKALQKGRVLAAGLDVLESESPDFSQYEWLQKENVIITPHAAFYSQQSMEDLRRISCDNLVYYFTNQLDQISKIIL